MVNKMPYKDPASPPLANRGTAMLQSPTVERIIEARVASLKNYAVQLNARPLNSPEAFREVAITGVEASTAEDAVEAACAFLKKKGQESGSLIRVCRVSRRAVMFVD